MTKLSVAILGIIFSLVMPYLAEASDKLSIAKKAAASQATQESRSRGKSDNYEDLRNVFRFVGKKFGIKASKNKDLYEEAFVLGRQYASHYHGVGLQRVVDQLVGGPQGLKSPEEQSKDDKERNVDNLIMGLQVLDYAQDALEFDLEELEDPEEMTHVKGLQARAEEYLTLVLRVWRYGLKLSRGQKDEDDWKNLVFCIKYAIHMLTIDLEKLRGVTKAEDKIRVMSSRFGEYLPQIISKDTDGNVYLMGEDEPREILSKEEFDRLFAKQKAKGKNNKSSTKSNQEL